MTRNRLMIPQFVALVAAVLVLGPARSAEPDARTEDSKRMVDLLEKIEKRLGTQQAATDVLMEIVRKDLKDLRDEVARLQREVNDLRRTPPPATTASNYPTTPPAPTPGMAMTPLPSTALVRLVNTYPANMTAMVNGVNYVVPAFQTRDVPVPAGVATFQVHQVAQPAQVRTLSANETLTLTLFPV